MREVKDRPVSAFDAKTHLSRLLREVERGRSITITRHGRAVARLVPVADSSAPDTVQLLTAFRAIRETAGRPLKVTRLIKEGRKY